MSSKDSIHSQKRRNYGKIEALQNTKNVRILLVEDNSVNQKVAVLMLNKLGLRVDVAANGIEAVDSFKRQSYDIILMDVQMPEMDGIEATRIIREKSTSDSGPIIFAMTAGVTENERERCIEVGMNGFIHKPVKTDIFRKVISDALEGIE